jgi:hypothetical protein
MLGGRLNSCRFAGLQGKKIVTGAPRSNETNAVNICVVGGW